VTFNYKRRGFCPSCGARSRRVGPPSAYAITCRAWPW
jgi:hypothetical protein